MLEARSVLMQFGGLKALNEVDLTRRKRGTIHGLIGPNGSGKSTMMNVLTGIYEPTAGTIEFDGARWSAERRRDIALSGIARTFQNVQLFGEMTAQRERAGRPAPHLHAATCSTSLLHTPRYRAKSAPRHRRAAGMLQFVGLADVAHRRGAQPALRQAAPAGDRARAGARPADCCCSTSPRPA